MSQFISAKPFADIYIFIVGFLLLSCSACASETTGSDQRGGQSSQTVKSCHIVWDESTYHQLSSGGGCYGRVHELSDGRLMACYESGGGNSSVRFSTDCGTTWGNERIIARSFNYTNPDNSQTAKITMNNPEFAQLSTGRILMAFNQRTTNTAAYPYSISIIWSDDNGATWSTQKVIYQSKLWNPHRTNGCWEPFVLEPAASQTQSQPAGSDLVQIYFSDETPYSSNTSPAAHQNISVLESDTSCSTWTAPRIVSYSAGHRDGMPVATVYKGNIYVSIEDNTAGPFKPSIVYSPIMNSWSSPVSATSQYRFNPLQTDIPTAIYAGAPYLVQTENYFVLSFQDAAGSGNVSVMDHAVMKVEICPKTAVKDEKFTKEMVPVYQPFTVDQTSVAVLWNALCPLKGDKVIAIGTSAGHVYTKTGRIVER